MPVPITTRNQEDEKVRMASPGLGSTGSKRTPHRIECGGVPPGSRRAPQAAALTGVPPSCRPFLVAIAARYAGDGRKRCPATSCSGASESARQQKWSAKPKPRLQNAMPVAQAAGARSKGRPVQQTMSRRPCRQRGGSAPALFLSSALSAVLADELL